MAAACVAVEDVDAALFGKVALNAATVPMCIAARGGFGRAFECAEAVECAAAVLRECVDVWNEETRGRALTIGGETVSGGLSSQRARRAVRRLVRAYPLVIPSAVFDAVRGRPTELPYFHDDILELAKKAGVETPKLRRLALITKGLVGSAAGGRYAHREQVRRLCLGVMG
jgi:ketopantoate reductase